MANVEDLDVYRRSHALTLRIYELTKRFPADERFGLAAQMRRAAGSVPMNLAEGSGRATDRELGRFTSIAQGSLTELRYQVMLARDLEYLDGRTCAAVRDEIGTIGKMLNGLKRYVTDNQRLTTDD